MHQGLARWVALLLVLSACGTPAPAPIDAGRDAATITDAGADDAGLDAAMALDAGASDAGLDAAMRLDAGPPPVGVVTGTCGVLDDEELLGAMPYLFENVLDLPMGYTDADAMRLSEGAQEILRDGTAGGSSGLSEAFSFEVLHVCEGAELVASETEVRYDPVDSDKTDILVRIDGHLIGVSVTRAVGFPRDSEYTVATARTLLERKLASILESSANVVPEQRWEKQILHVIAYEARHADAMRMAWEMVDPALRADTILWITVTEGDDAAIY